MALLVCASLVFLPYDTLLYNATDTPRRLLLLLGGGVLLAWRVWGWAGERRVTVRWHVLDVFVLLLGVGAVVSGVLAAYPRVAFFAPLWSHEALPFWGLGVVWYAVVKGWLRTPDQRGRAARALVLTGGAVAVLGVLDHLCDFNFSPAHSGQRLVATLGNPMFTGTYLAMLIPLGLGLALTTPARRPWLLGATGLMAVALVLTQTRAAWVGLAVTLLVMLALAAWRLRGRVRLSRRAWGGAALAGLALLALLLGPPQIRARVASLARPDGGTIATRRVYMAGAYRLFRARPLHGWGVANLSLVFPQYRPSSTVRELDIPLNRGHATALPHNLTLQIAADMGLLGLMPYFALILATAYVGIRRLRPDHPEAGLTLGALGLLTAYLVTNQFSFDNAATLATAATGLGLLAAIDARERTLFPRPHGDESPALSRNTARILRGTALLLGAATVLLVVTQAAAAYYADRGSDVVVDRAPSLTRQDPRRAQREIRGALDDLHAARALTLVPSYLNHRQLCQAYFALKHAALAAGDTDAARQAHAAMLRQGRITLRMLPRDPEVLRCLTLELTADGDLAGARRYAERLLRYEPYSAEARLFYGDVVARQGELAAASREASTAIELDPTFAEAYARRARYQFMAIDRVLMGQVPGRDALALVRGQDARGNQDIATVCRQFATAESRGMTLAAADTLRYATALYLHRDFPTAQTIARRLHGAPEWDILRQRLQYFSWATGTMMPLPEMTISKPQPPSPARRRLPWERHP